MLSDTSIILVHFKFNFVCVIIVGAKDDDVKIIKVFFIVKCYAENIYCTVCGGASEGIGSIIIRTLKAQTNYIFICESKIFFYLKNYWSIECLCQGTNLRNDCLLKNCNL